MLWMFWICNSWDDVSFCLSALISAAVLSLKFMKTEVCTLWLELVMRMQDIFNIMKELLIVEAVEVAEEATVNNIVNN